VCREVGFNGRYRARRQNMKNKEKQEKSQLTMKNELSTYQTKISTKKTN